MNSYTVKLTQSQADELANLLEEENYAFQKVPYSYFSYRKPGIIVTCYQKELKLLIQGNLTKEFIEFTLEPKITKNPILGNIDVYNSEMFNAHFGVDESGKGDYFGPLVIAGVYSNKQSAKLLLEAGVCDSKQISSPEKIIKLAQFIKSIPEISYSIITIGPERYNQLHTKMGNLNYLLAWGHIQIISDLKIKVPSCNRALSDQFAHQSVLLRFLRQKKLSIELEQRTKAESDIAVAAASILARDQFVSWMKRTSDKIRIPLPLGASPQVVKAAKQFVSQYGSDSLGKIAKLHFKTTQKVLS